MLEVLPASRVSGRPSVRCGLLATCLHGALVVAAVLLMSRPGMPIATARPFPITYYPTESRERPSPVSTSIAAPIPTAPQITVPWEVPGDLPAPVPTDPARTGTPSTGLKVTGARGATDIAGALTDGPEVSPGGPGGILTARLVDEPASVLEPRRPHYPRALEAARVSGQVVVEFVVDTGGRAEPGSVHIVTSSHFGFEGSAREAVLGTLFRPGRLGGRPVRQLVRQTVSFVARP
jgi:TonB family protein